MKRTLIFLMIGACVSAGSAQTTRPATPAATAPATRPAPKSVAVVLSGLGGSKAYSRHLTDWTRRFVAVLTGPCKLAPANVLVLAETADPKAAPPWRQSTRDNFRAVMKEAAERLTPLDQFILVLNGHGQINEPKGKLCLSGRDIDSEELSEILDLLPTRNVVMINTASGGAEFLDDCAADDRVILTGAGAGNDGTAAYFAEFFLRGYETGGADADAGKTIDLYEAYAYAARETANFYHRQYLVSTTRRDPGDPLVWLVRGKETRQIWKRLYADTANILGTPRRQPDDPPLGDLDNEPDPDPAFGRFDKHWHNRRVLSEHARLDDSGTKRGFYLWQPYEFQKPPPDEPGKEGRLARRTILGRPAALAAIP